MLAVIGHLVDDNPFSNTAYAYTPAHGVRNTDQQLMHKSQLLFSWAMALTGQS